MAEYKKKFRKKTIFLNIIGFGTLISLIGFLYNCFYCMYSIFLKPIMERNFHRIDLFEMNGFKMMIVLGAVYLILTLVEDLTVKTFKIQNKNKFRKPEKGERYYYCSFGKVCEFTWDDNSYDYTRYKDGNYFFDKQEAEKATRVRNLAENLKNIAKDGEDDGEKYEICYNGIEIYICLSLTCPWIRNIALLFNSEEAAQQAIDKYHDELIWYFTEYR